MISFATIPETERNSSGTPYRSITRAKYVPEGRTLHVLDPENIGGFHEGFETEYTTAIGGLGHEDHVVIGVDPGRFIRAYHTFRRLTGRIIGGSGKDGADIALLRELRETDFVVSRYDRVLIGSGDHIFAPAAAQLVECGIVVGVIARYDSLSATLADSASFTITMPPLRIR